jgi:hypothetical protein
MRMLKQQWPAAANKNPIFFASKTYAVLIAFLKNWFSLCQATQPP